MSRFDTPNTFPRLGGTKDYMPNPNTFPRLSDTTGLIRAWEWHDFTDRHRRLREQKQTEVAPTAPSAVETSDVPTALYDFLNLDPTDAHDRAPVPRAQSYEDFKALAVENSGVQVHYLEEQQAAQREEQEQQEESAA